MQQQSYGPSRAGLPIVVILGPLAIGMLIGLAVGLATWFNRPCYTYPPFGAGALLYVVGPIVIGMVVVGLVALTIVKSGWRRGVAVTVMATIGVLAGFAIGSALEATRQNPCDQPPAPVERADLTMELEGDLAGSYGGPGVCERDPNGTVIYIEAYAQDSPGRWGSGSSTISVLSLDLGSPSPEGARSVRFVVRSSGDDIGIYDGPGGSLIIRCRTGQYGRSGTFSNIPI